MPPTLKPDEPPAVPPQNGTQHPFTADAESVPSVECQERVEQAKVTQAFLNWVLILAVGISVVPVGVYTIGNFVWGWRLSGYLTDLFLLFSAAGNLTAILVIFATVIYVRKSAATITSIDQIVDVTLTDFKRFKSRLLGVTYDIESFSSDWDKFLEVYHTNKHEVRIGLRMMPKLIKILPALERRFGKRLENFEKLTPEQQDLIVEEMLRDPSMLSPPKKKG